nr:hypothetical protein [Micromonospora sp. DSM 115978]
MTSTARLGALVLFVAMLVACDASDSTAPSAAPSATVRPVAMCASVLPSLDALWDPARNSTPGFGAVDNLAKEPDLYYTSWSLRLARIARLELSVDRDQVAGWLAERLQHGSSRSTVAGSMAVDEIELVVTALVSIESTVNATDLARNLDRLRAGDGYRFTDGDEQSWPATLLAVEASETAGIEVPAPVRTALRRSVPEAVEATTPDEILQVGLPILAALSRVQSASDVLATIPQVDRVLTRWREATIEAGPSGVGLGLLADLREISDRLGLPWQPPPDSYLAALSTGSGYYSVQPGGQGDPQVTYYATLVGGAVPADAATAIRTGQVRQGWLHPIAPASLDSTYRAVMVARLCGATPHPEPMARQVRSWLAESSRTWRSGGAPDGRLPHDLRRVCALAEVYGVRPVDELPTVADLLGEDVAGQAGADPAGVAAGLMAADGCGLELDTEMRDTLRAALEPVQPSNAHQAAGLALSGSLLDDGQMIGRAREYLSSLWSDGGFRHSPAAATPDLITTQMGFAVGAAPPDSSAQETLAGFLTPAGPAYEQPGARAESGAEPPVVDLLSLEAGLRLATADTRPMLLP